MFNSNNANALKIMRNELDFSSATEWMIASGFDIQKISLDLINNKIYWTSELNNNYRIYRADLSGSNIEVFLQLSSKATGLFIAQ